MDKVLKERRAVCLFWEKDQLAWKWKEVRRPGQGSMRKVSPLGQSGKVRGWTTATWGAPS